jgi:hypothetical protein
MEITIIHRLESLEKKQPGLKLMLCAVLLALAVVMLLSFKNSKEADAKKELQLKERIVEEEMKIPKQYMAGTGILIQGREDIEWNDSGVHDDELAILISGLH